MTLARYTYRRAVASTYTEALFLQYKAGKMTICSRHVSSSIRFSMDDYLYILASRGTVERYIDNLAGMLAGPRGVDSCLTGTHFGRWTLSMSRFVQSNGIRPPGQIAACSGSRHNIRPFLRWCNSVAAVGETHTARDSSLQGPCLSRSSRAYYLPRNPSHLSWLPGYWFNTRMYWRSFEGSKM